MRQRKETGSKKWDTKRRGHVQRVHVPVSKASRGHGQRGHVHVSRTGRNTYKEDMSPVPGADPPDGPRPTPQSVFPSVKIFTDKGFRVLPTSLRDVKAVRSFIDQSLALQSDKVLGHLCTLWHLLTPGTAAKLPQLRAASNKIRKASSGS